MSYADFSIKRYERLVDDEFERSILHKSSTVALAYNDWLSLGSAVVLAWILPGHYSVAGLIAIIPITLSRFIGVQWLRRSIPRPRYLAPSKREFVLLLVCFAAMTVGVFQNIGWPKDPFSFLLPVSGGLLGSYYAYKRSAARREEDRKILDRKLGPDLGEGEED